MHHLLIQFRVTVGLEPVPHVIEGEAGWPYSCGSLAKRVNVSSQLTERWLIKGETDHLKEINKI